MNNNATRLDTWQQCPRRELLLREWTPLKWRQKALFTAVFRRAVFAVSNGADPRQTADDAKALGQRSLNHREPMAQTSLRGDTTSAWSASGSTSTPNGFANISGTS